MATTADEPKKTPEQIALEKRAADLGTIIGNLPAGSKILARKQADLAAIQAELEALKVK